VTAVDFSPADAGLLGACLLVLWLPGGLLAAVAGLRGWTLAATAPLLTYALAGLTGPWAAAVGIPFNPVTLAVVTLVVTGALAALRRFRRLPGTSAKTTSKTKAKTTAEAGPERSPWSLAGNLAVAACVVAGTVAGAVAVLRGIGRLSVIHQDWDAPFHANGTRWIAETGDGGLFAMSHINWYEIPPGIFYPNAYHLVASVGYRLTGAEVTSVLNAHLVLLPGLAALTLATLVRAMNGRAVTAGCTALVAAAAGSMTYDLIWRGPLLPFAIGITLTPLAVVLLARYLDRPSIVDGVLLTLGAAGLLSLHSSTLFGAILFALPYVLYRWWTSPARLRREPLLALPVAVAGALITLPHLLGAIDVASAYPPMNRPADLTTITAVGSIATFQHGGVLEFLDEPVRVATKQSLIWTYERSLLAPQLWLGLALLLGVLTAPRLGVLGWLLGSAGLLGGLFVLASCYEANWINEITRPWWNDRFRLAALTVVALCPLAGHGLAEAQRLLVRLAAPLARRLPAARVGVPAAMAGLVVAVLVIGTGGLYVDINAARVAAMHRDGLTVTEHEEQAYRELARMVRPGERVMNDRGDGSPWMYSVAGVRPVAGHVDGLVIGPDAKLLAARFNAYDTDPAVRAAAERLGVRYAVVGKGFLRRVWRREPGMTRLDRVRALEKVYENQDAVIYRLTPR
jgi:hypothetical protein